MAKGKNKPQPNDSNKNIGKRVKMLRKKNHMTQVALGQMTSTTNKHISEIERGIVSMSIDMQIQLSRALHCSLDYLILGEEFQSVDNLLPPEIVKILLSQDQAEIGLLQEYLETYKKVRTK